MSAQRTIKTSLIVVRGEGTAAKQVLLISEKEGKALPAIAGGTANDVMVGVIQQAVKEQLNWDVAVGRMLYSHKEAETNKLDTVYEVQLLSDIIADSNSTWVALEELKQIKLANELHRNAIEKCLKEVEIPAVRAPWFRKGWYQKAENWIKETVQEMGLELTAPLKQIKSSDFCTVLQVPTNKGELYFKATGTAARHEVKLTEHLAELYPGKSVAIAASQSNEGWLLMEDVGGEPLRGNRNIALWQRAIREYAEFQMQEAEQLKELIAIGVPNRGLSVLKEHIKEHLLGMCATGLDEKETAEVMALEEELLMMCDKLEAAGLPLTLDHGDLHSANIRILNNQPKFFDWGDASITHPFFSTRVFWHALDELLESEAEWLDMVDRFRPHYLEPWTKFAPMHVLEELLQISDQLACVYRALSWYLYLTPDREDKEESYRRPSQWLQLVLEHRALIAEAANKTE